VTVVIVPVLYCKIANLFFTIHTYVSPSRIVYQGLEFCSRPEKFQKSSVYFKTRLLDSHGVVISDEAHKTKYFPCSESNWSDPDEFTWTEEHNLHCASFAHVQVSIACFDCNVIDASNTFKTHYLPCLKFLRII
jgi:hypothetical protein